MHTRYSAGKLANGALPLLLQMLTAAICSRATFALLDDPEGPNLVVVTGPTVIIYLASLVAYFSGRFPTLTGSRRAVATIPIQMLAAAALYLALR